MSVEETGKEQSSSVEETIRGQIDSHNVLLYMKGKPDAPMCGFSAQAAQILMACGVHFNYVNILDAPEIRATLPKIANWPTFPQLWVDGELVGGSDIMVEMFEKGELKPLLESAGSAGKAEA